MTKQIEIVKPESIVEIKLSGSFYAELQRVLLYLSNQVDPEELNVLVEKINSGTPDDEFSDWEVCVQTMMILCAEIEEKAKEQGLIETVDIPVTQ